MRFVDGKMRDLGFVEALESDNEKGRAFERQARLLRVAMDCVYYGELSDAEQLLRPDLDKAKEQEHWAR